jgi:hypothetical protein
MLINYQYQRATYIGCHVREACPGLGAGFTANILIHNFWHPKSRKNITAWSVWKLVTAPYSHRLEWPLSSMTAKYRAQSSHILWHTVTGIALTTRDRVLLWKLTVIQLIKKLWNPKSHYRIHKSVTDPYLNGMKPVHIFISYCFKICNIIPHIRRPTASADQLSEFLATDPEVPSSIPGPTKFSEK